MLASLRSILPIRPLSEDSFPERRGFDGTGFDKICRETRSLIHSLTVAKGDYLRHFKLKNVDSPIPDQSRLLYADLFMGSGLNSDGASLVTIGDKKGDKRLLIVAVTTGRWNKEKAGGIVYSFTTDKASGMVLSVKAWQNVLGDNPTAEEMDWSPSQRQSALRSCLAASIRYREDARGKTGYHSGILPVARKPFKEIINEAIEK